MLRQAPSRFALAGTSAGGNLALEICAQAPERVAGRQSERVRAGEFDAVVDELAARMPHRDGPRSAEAEATFRGMAHRAGPEGFVRQNAAMITRRDRWHALDEVHVPTRLLWGRHDQFSSVERATAIAARVASARLIVLEDCGHLPTLEHPEPCTGAAREWLRQCREAAGAG